MTERKRLLALAKACKLFAEKKKKKALMMLLKYKFSKLPFFNREVLWSVARLKGFFLLNNPRHYGRFFLVGKGAVPHLYRVAKKDFVAFTKGYGFDDMEVQRTHSCYLVNDGSIPQLPTSVMYKLFLYWEEWNK